jgi:hypothetical protein
MNESALQPTRDLTELLKPGEQREILTYSADTAFRNCRMLYKLRYQEKLGSTEADPEPLWFGALLHRALGILHWGKLPQDVFQEMGPSFERLRSDPEKRKWWHLLRAMILGYTETLPVLDYVAVEEFFWGEILNPATGASSRSFILGGKVDGVARIDGENWLIECKSASQIDATYLERLWTDFQTTLYLPYIETWLNLPIAGVLYEVLLKSGIRQAQEETETDFAERRAGLLAKSKTGKTTAQRQLGESDEEFGKRLHAWYREPGRLGFHREKLYVSRDRLEALRAELWEHTQAILDARRRRVWYQNPSHCFAYNRPCEMWRYCSSGFDSTVRETFYAPREPHQELRNPGI